MAAFPKYFVLRSEVNNKNLQFHHEPETRFHGSIKSSGDNIVSPYTKLEVEVSQSDKSLIHVKNCYNNKYWEASSDPEILIRANANEPEEDQSKPTCTLFRPTFDHDAKTVRLAHVNMGKPLLLITPANHSKDVLFMSPRYVHGSRSDVFTVIDWSSIMILPRNLGFKVHGEDAYLAASPANGKNYLKFEANDEWSPEVRQEVSVTGDGNVMIRSVYYDKYWACADTSIILANGNYTPSDSKLLFRADDIGAGANVIGLYNMGDHPDYCKRLIVENNDEINNAISAADATITTLSKLEIIELVTKRLVHNVDFKVNDGKIITLKAVPLDTKEAINTDGQKDKTDVELKFSWNPSSSTWNSSANGSLTVGTETGISSKIPSVDEDGKIILSKDEYKNDDILWGKPTLISGSEQSATFIVKRVPPKTKVTVTALGDKQTCEIPFSYTQTNTVDGNGTSDSFDMDDGNYTGLLTTSFANSFKVEVTRLP